MSGSVVARWFPASVLLPNGGGVLRKRYVVVMRGGEHDGITVFGAPDVSEFVARVDWAATTITTLRSEQRAGVELVVADGGGSVVVTVGVECRCGGLGRWAGPAWANTVEV